LQCEASPIIAHFNLRSYPDSPFPIYYNETMALIVSGIGKINCAAATAYLQVLRGGSLHSAWLNIGIAGHSEYPLGKGLLVHQIIKRWPVRLDCSERKV
jgi:adenosylhomocysteine nucleosidase